MAVTRAQKLRLGVFVAVGLGALVGGLALLAGMKLGEQKDGYTVRFSDGEVSLSGLDVGSPVKYSGIRVGRVKSIRIDPKDVSVIVVTLSLDGGTPVAEDTVASLGSLGITGLKYVELSRGSRKSRVREPGEEIPAGPSFIDEISDQASAIATKLNVLIDRANTFATPDMKSRVVALLDRGNHLLETAEQTLSENRGNIRLLSGKVTELAEKLGALSMEMRGTVSRASRLLEETRPRVVALAEELRGLTAELRGSRQKLDDVLDESRVALQTAKATLGDEGLGKTLVSADQLVTRGYLVLLQSQEDIADAVGNLKEAAENLSAFSQRIREDPSLLLLGTGDEELER